MGGWLSVFAAQALAGAIIGLLVARLLGAPIGLPAIYCAVFFAIGAGLSGVAFSVMWATLFFQLAGLVLGLSMGYWINLPSWWTLVGQEWEQGSTIPKSFILTGIFLPPLWTALCTPLHKLWSWMLLMVFDKLKGMLSRKESVDERRRTAAKRLAVSDIEAERALKETRTDAEGLIVVARSKIVREENALEELEEDDVDPYEALSVGADAPELSGLSDAAAKTRQKVDASGAVLKDDSPASSGGPAAAGTSASPESDARPPRENPPAPQVATPAAPMSGSERHRLTFLAEEYNIAMTTGMDEQKSLADFVGKHREALLGMSDADIHFLRMMSDGAGLGLAATAMTVQDRSPSVATSFEEDVARSLALPSGSEFERPTATVPDDERDAPARSGMVGPDAALPDDREPAALVEEEPFVAEFSFSGDEAARSASGRRAASLLSMAAAVSETSTASRFGDFVMDDETSDSSNDAPQEDETEQVPPAAAVSMEAGTEGAELSSSSTRDRFAERMRLIGQRVSDGGDQDSVGSDDIVDMVAQDEVVEEEFGGFVVSGDAADDVDDDAVGTVASDAPDAGDGFRNEGDAVVDEEDSEMNIPANVTPLQALMIYKAVIDVELTPAERLETILSLEHMEGGLPTLVAIRSHALPIHLGEKSAHEVRNVVTALMRDHKDVRLEELGSLASEAEAKIIELKAAPYKIDGDRISDLWTGVRRMEELLKVEGSSALAMNRKVRVTNIRGGIASLQKILDERNAPKPRSAPPTREQKDKAAEMFRKMGRGEAEIVGGEVGEEMDLSDAEADGQETEVDDEAAVETAPDGHVATDAVDEDVAMPWLDPDLGDLDAEFPIIPEGLDANTPEGAAEITRRAALHTRRIEAKRLRDEHDALERALRAEMEEEERLRLEKAGRIATVEQREELAREREAELDARARSLAIEAERMSSEIETLRADREALMERSRVVDKIEQVLGRNPERKADSLQFLNQSMQGFFEVREVPERFGKVAQSYMHLALTRAIQKRVKVSSISLQGEVLRDAGDSLPDRLYPHKNIVAFHGATIYRKAREMFLEIAADCDATISIPDTADGEIKIDALLEKADGEGEREFIIELRSWLTAARAEFFQLQQDAEENAEDFRLARDHASAAVAEDVDTLTSANVALKEELEKEKARADRLERDLRAERERPRSGGLTDDVEDAREMLGMFEKERFFLVRGKTHAEVFGQKVVLGILPENDDMPSASMVREEMRRGSHEPFVIFTNMPEEDAMQIFSEEAMGVSLTFRPLATEVVADFIEQQLKKEKA